MTKPYCIGSDEWNGLSKLIEEMGELNQVCGKLIGSEGSTDHWSGDLRTKFIEEIGDVVAAVTFFAQKNFTGNELDAIDRQIKKKFDRFNQWNKDVRDV